jgi:hypothetical protein
MSANQLLTDIIKIITDATGSGPLPSITDEAAVTALAVKVVPDLIALGYDLAGGATASSAHAECCAMSATDLKALVMASVNPTKLGDGSLLSWLVANLPSIIALITGFFPKPAPVPTPA